MMSQGTESRDHTLGASSGLLAIDRALEWVRQHRAPGGGILSTYPLELGGTAVLSGTSMSSPHVAGAVALILEAKPGINAGQMMERLQNVADPKSWSGNAALGLLDHSFRQGAGMLDIVGAVTANALVTPGQIATGESASGSHIETLTLHNMSSSPASYTVSHVSAVAAGPNNIGTGGSKAGFRRRCSITANSDHAYTRSAKSTTPTDLRTVSR